METSCANPDCTVGQTGICLLNNPVETCSNRIGNKTPPTALAGLPPVLATPVSNVRLPPSLALDAALAERIASKRPCIQVGILGLPASGKTAALVSLYLLVAKGLLDGFEFRNSASLMAFDKLSRGARRWDSTSLPEQLTAHTEIADGRTAGYLHLKLYSKGSENDVDFLLPDLPGEWTKALIDNNRTDRLEFLKACSAIWMFVDGRRLLDAATRQHSLHRCEMVLRRLVKFIPESLKIILVVTHKDDGTPAPGIFSDLNELSKELGIRLTVHHIASFAEADSQTAAGEGIAELIAQLCTPVEKARWFEAPRTGRSRAVDSFRGWQ